MYSVLYDLIKSNFTADFIDQSQLSTAISGFKMLLFISTSSLYNLKGKVQIWLSRNYHIIIKLLSTNLLGVKFVHVSIIMRNDFV